MTDVSAAVKTDVLIVGVGPAGGTAALARLGVDIMAINKYPWTAPPPRSHITNQRTVEVLRDLGLAEEALALATPNDLMGENTYCTSIAGEELGRLRTWGTQPQRRSDYELASPERICDLPQNLLEPLLVGAWRAASVSADAADRLRVAMAAILAASTEAFAESPAKRTVDMAA
jgi:2,4-dichlorophenol 6-monooxygenase